MLATDLKKYRDLVTNVAQKKGIPFSLEAHSIDAFLPLIELMRSEGAVFILKWDGGRGEGDNGPYTALVSGGPLMKGDFFRTDADSIEDALSYVIVNYAQVVWGEIE